MSKVKRFPNPNSDINMFIEIFRRTYSILSEKEFFSLYDLMLAMINNYLVSSEGFTGMKAFELSLRNNASKDPIYNQAKMYAELYRMMGWYSPSKDRNLIFTITELGKYVAESDCSNEMVFKECIMGMADDNEVIEKKDGLSMRPFKYFLNVANILDGKICKLELIYGPYRYPDKEIKNAINDIRKVRGNYSKLLKEIEHFSRAINVSQITMENYTRFPISTLDYLGWFKKNKSAELYPGSKNMVVMTITEKGKKDLKYYNNLYDLRNDEYKKYPDNIKNAIVRVSFYQQIKRIGVDNVEIHYNLEEELKIINNYFKKEINFLYSPYQMLDYADVNRILKIHKIWGSTSKPIEKKDLLDSIESYNRITDEYTSSIGLKTVFYKETDKDKNKEIYKDIISRKDLNENKIIEEVMEKYKTSNKDIYYPLIGDIFNILGFDCRVSRNGTNYERYDAIIVSDRSMPIEIKSPGEEQNISVKAVRQALENKIILLSRKNYNTVWDTTSLVVGYLPPNNRAEVLSLIDDIKKIYDVKIALFDFETLLKLLINKILYNKVLINNEIFELKGLVTVDE